MGQLDWSVLTPTEKKEALFLKQKELLDTFLAHHAITQAQYDKSLGDLKEKMNIPKEVEIRLTDSSSALC